MSPSTPSIPPAKDRQARVLVVDDEPGMCHAATRVLSAEHQVQAASSPAEALAIAPEFRPDLVVSDIRMPGMDGFALVARLRELRPDLDVIFMTGSQTEPDAMLVRAIEHEAFYFIEKPFDRRVLSTLVRRCLELRRLRQAERAHATRMADELARARVFQDAMLAPRSSTLPGLEIVARAIPCQELGGDFYDYAPLPGGGTLLVVADACGHGVTAAMLTAVVKSVFQRAVARGSGPDAFAEALASALEPFGDDRYVTAVCARLTPSAAGVRLEYVNAGHPPPIVWSGSDAPRLLPEHAPILSRAFPKGSWPSTSVDLPAGAGILIYTDGLSDRLDRSPSAAAKLIRDHVAAAKTRDPASLSESLLRRVTGDPAADDITVLAARTI